LEALILKVIIDKKTESTLLKIINRCFLTKHIPSTIKKPKVFEKN